MSLVILSSKNQPNPENFDAILGETLELPAHSQVCCCNVECELNTDIVIDSHNDTFYYGTGNTWEDRQTDEPSMGLGMYEVKIPHGTYSASYASRDELSHITAAITVALNNEFKQYPHYVVPMFRGGWNCSYDADSKLQFELVNCTEARASGDTWMSNPIETLYDITGTTNEAVYEGTADALGLKNKITLTSTCRGGIGNNALYLPLSENADATGNNRGGLEFMLKIDAGVSVETLCGFYGLVAENNKDTFLKTVNSNDLGFLNGLDDTGLPTYQIPTTWKQECYLDFGFYIDPDGHLFIVDTEYTAYRDFTTTDHPNANRQIMLYDTGLDIDADGVNDRDLWLSIRGIHDGGNYKLNTFYSLETRGDPIDYVSILDTMLTPAQLTLSDALPVAISCAASTDVPVEINGDFYTIGDLREPSTDGTNKDLLMWVGRGNLEELNNLNITTQANILNQANLQMLWYVNPIDTTQQFEANYILCPAGDSSDPDNLKFGNMENNPNYQMALIQIPSLPVKGNLGVAGEGGNSNACVGVFMLGKDEEQFKYENWIDLHNSNHITLNNLNVMITNIYGQPLGNMWNSTKVVLKFRVNPHHLQRSLLRDSIKQQKLLIDMLTPDPKETPE